MIRDFRPVAIICVCLFPCSAVFQTNYGPTHQTIESSIHAAYNQIHLRALSPRLQCRCPEHLNPSRFQNRCPIPGSPGAVAVWTPDGREPEVVAFQGCLEHAGGRLASALKRREVAEQAVRDPLTGLLNGTGIREVMAASGSGNGALIEVQLDDLGILKNELGEPARDSALVSVSRLLLRGVRGIDAVARIATSAPFMGVHPALWPSGLRDQIIARALGRALAHEIGHYLLASKDHTSHGLMKAQHKAGDLLGPSRRPFELTESQRSGAVARLADPDHFAPR